MPTWVPIAAGIVVLTAASAFLVGRAREASRAKDLEVRLLEKASRPAGQLVDFDSLPALPAPVERYFRLVLTDGQPLIRRATLTQSGTLRTSTATPDWLPFAARHLAVPAAPGFLWDANLAGPWGTHIRVLDSYANGRGAGRVSLLSALPIASRAGEPALNAGALHRYLAEAVWYPTALLPQSGVAWKAIDDDSALAVLTDRDTSVSLEFRFNETGEIRAIHTPGRFGLFDGEFREVAWEGHFADYQGRSGMRVPLYGEVGWYDDGALQLVWKGKVIGAEYEFNPQARRD